MKYLKFGSDGALITRYDSDIHGERQIKIQDTETELGYQFVENPNLPSDSIEVSDELFWQTVNENDGIWKRDPATGDIAKHPFPAPTPDQIKTAKIATVQSHMDQAASACGYDDIKTVCTYAEEPAVAKFQNEGRAFRAWRSLVWAQCYAILDEVNAGARDIPTDEELISELPALVLPE